MTETANPDRSHQKATVPTAVTGQRKSVLGKLLVMLPCSASSPRGVRRGLPFIPVRLALTVLERARRPKPPAERKKGEARSRRGESEGDGNDRNRPSTGANTRSPSSEAAYRFDVRIKLHATNNIVAKEDEANPSGYSKNIEARVR